jgi:hypothetical protein
MRLIIEPSGEVNTGANLGTGSGIFAGKSGSTLQFKSIVPGASIVVTGDNQELTISSAASGAGEANTSSNLGAGEGVFSAKVGVDLRLKSLVAGTNVSLSSDSNEITINASGGGAASGESNTASNVGSGTGIFKQKTGVDLEFKSLFGLSGVVLDNQTNEINIGTPDLPLLRADFSNSSGNFRTDIDANTTNVSNLETDFTNSSGVFQNGVDVANAVRTDFDNSSGVFRSDIDTNTSSISSLQTDFTNSSGVFQGGVNTANQVRTDFDNSSGTFAKGEGTIDRIPRWQTTDTLQDSNIAQSGTHIGIGTVIPKNQLDIAGGAVIGGSYAGVNVAPVSGLLVEGLMVVGDTAPTDSLVTLDVNGRIYLIDELVFRNDPDTMFRRRTANETEIRCAGQDIVRFDVNGAFVEPPNLVIENSAGRLLAQGSSAKAGIRTSSPSGVLHVEGDIHTPVVEQAISGTSTIDLSQSNIFRCPLQASGSTVQFINQSNGGKYTLLIEQNNAAAGTIITWPTTFRWRSGSAPTITASSGAVDIVTFTYDGGDDIYYGDIDTSITNLQTDFTNSSGIFQNGVNTANQVRTDFDNASGVWVKDGENLGSGSGLFVQKDSDTNLEFKTLVAGSNVTLTGTATEITISSSGGGAGETNTASNLGSGSGIFAQKSGVDLEFKSLVPGGGIQITGDANELTITSVASGAGEANTASNLGLGQEVFSDKSGVDLRFRRLLGSSGIVVSTSGNTIRFDNTILDDFDILNTDFTNASGNWTSDITNAQSTADGVRTDFDNSSGIFRNDIDQNSTDISNLQTDFTNSSGVFRTDIDTNTTNISNLQTDFTNSSGIFQGGVDTANGVRTDFDNASGVWIKDGANVGIGTGDVFAQKSGTNLEFRRILQGSGIQVSTSGSTIRIDSQLEDDVSINASNISSLQTDFTNSSGTFRNDIDTNTTNISNLQTDFTNSSGVFRNDIDQNTTDISNLQTDFTNSSGVFQNGVDTANGVRTDFDNSSGVFRSDIDTNTTNISSLQTDFTNSSGVFQGGVDTADQVRVDFDNSSGIFRTDIDSNTTNISNLQTDFTNSSGVFRNDIDTNATNISNLTTDFTNSSGVFQTGTNTANQVRTDFDNASGIWVKDGENLGAGSGVFVQKDTDENLEFKTLVAGSNVTLTATATEITIGAASPSGGEANTASNVGIGTGESFAQKSGSDLEFRRILQGSGIQIATSGSTIRIDSALEDDVQANTSNISSLQTDFTNSSGVFRNDIDTNTTNITNLQTDFTNSSGIFQGGVDTANAVRTDFDNASGIWVKDGENLGAGSGVFVQKDTDENLEFKTLVAGANVSLTGDASTITISTSSGVGEANTASNVGLGVGVFAEKSGVDLEFRRLLQGSGIQIAASGDTVRIDCALEDDVSTNATNINTLRTDFDNSSGVFRSDIDTNTTNISSLQADFTNSSGIFQNGVDTADGVRTDFDNSSGTFRNDIDTNTTNISSLQTDFTNSSGIFQGGVNTANQVRTDFDNSSGVFRGDIDTNTTNLSNLQTDFDNASGIWVKDGQNLGGAEEVFIQKDTDENLEFRTLIGGSGLIVSTSGSTIRFDNTFADDFGIINGNLNQLRADFDNSSGIFRSDIDTNTTNISNLQTDFTNSSGTFRNDIDTNTTNISNLQTDFTNSSGVFRNDIDTNTTNISNLQSDFDNSSGIFQGGVDVANQVRTDFDNSSGVFRSDIDTNTTNISNLQTDFDNASGIWVKNGENLGGAEEVFIQKDTDENLEFRTLIGGSGLIVSTSGSTIRFDNTFADDFGIIQSDLNQIRTDFDNSSGVFRSDIDTNTTNITNVTTDFTNSSGVFRNDIDNNTTNISSLQTDFTNSSGVFRSDIDTNTTNISNLTTDFTNSSGVFQAGVNTADQVRVDFDNSSGVFRSDIDTNTTNITNLTTDFANSSGVFRSDIDTNTTNITNLQTDFTNSSGIFRSDIDTNTTNISNLQTDFDNASGIWVKDGENLGAGSGVFVQKDTDNNLEFKTLIAAGNITITGDADTLTISTGAGVGEANDGANVGIGRT